MCKCWDLSPPSNSPRVRTSNFDVWKGRHLRSIGGPGPRRPERRQHHDRCSGRSMLEKPQRSEMRGPSTPNAQETLTVLGACRQCTCGRELEMLGTCMGESTRLTQGHVFPLNFLLGLGKCSFPFPLASQWGSEFGPWSLQSTPTRPKSELG